MVEKFLEGRGAVITGGASGFGRGIALAYAERGANLVLVDINEELLEKTSKEITQISGQKVIPIVCDVSNSDQVKAMAKQAVSELDNIFVLNNNAGIAINYGKNLLKVYEKMWDQMMSVNLKGQWIVAKAFGRKMRTQKIEPIAGKMIHTASIAGMVVDAMIPVYSLTKVGIIAMVKLLAQSLAPKVTVNSLSPGYHFTPMYLNRKFMKTTMDEGHVKTPLNRLGTIDDVVNVSLFLASPASNFITGHNFPVDGGVAEVGCPANYLITDI
ncbi:MAG: SDR family NAD(P)-dependent oxidoreductase [Promethearchaeota archaeon]